MGRRSECPWAVRLLALLSGIFMFAAVAQVFDGAVVALIAARSAQSQITEIKDVLDDLEVKRSVQQAFRMGGLFIPLEDVILSKPESAKAAGEFHQRMATVWVPVQFKVPWVGSFVYGFSKEFVIPGSTN